MGLKELKEKFWSKRFGDQEKSGSTGEEPDSQKPGSASVDSSGDPEASGKSESDPSGSGKKSIPDRYTIKQDEEGKSISCMEAPNITVRIVRGMQIPASMVRKQPERTIFLDGAASGEPVLDHEKQIYNLDHHEGCIRSFTYATCEQAMILLRKGLNLSEKKWMIWANDPDLDTVLSIWILLNHVHLKKNDPYVPGEIMPLIRLEGIIDGQGLEMQDLVALPPRLHKETTNRIAYLRAEEEKIKGEGRWGQIDFTDYTVRVLKKIDGLVYHPEDFKDFKGLEELARADINDQSSVVVYRADMGIYEVEEYLSRLYGKKPALIFLQKDRQNYTIRKSDLFSPLDLEHLYTRLNLMDRLVSARLSDNKWGGSAEIGGSPRKTGTDLSPYQLVNICKQTYRKPSSLERGLKLLWGLFVGAFLTLPGWLGHGASISFTAITGMFSDPRLLPVYYLMPGSLVYVFIAFLIMARKRPWIYGFRLPAGKDWWIFLAPAMIGAALGGVWSPYETGGHVMRSSSGLILDMIAMPVILEILFRGLIHGDFQFLYPVQLPGRRWFLSIPVIATSAIYAFTMAIMPITPVVPFPDLVGELAYPSRVFGAALFGLASGMARERSQSIYVSLFFHLAMTLAVSLFVFAK